MENNGPEPDFIQLVTQARQGHRDSMARLAELAQPRLLTYLYRITLNYDLAQEMCQQVLVKMVQTLDSLRQIQSFWPWLFRRALGEVQHYFRDQRRRQMIEIAAMHEERFTEYVSNDPSYCYIPIS